LIFWIPKAAENLVYVDCGKIEFCSLHAGMESADGNEAFFN